MEFNAYQVESHKTAFYGEHIKPLAFVYSALGMAGEAGEASEKVKKMWRDNGGNMTPEHVDAIKKEMGDCLWYMAELATCLGITLEDVAVSNLHKLQDRMQRKQLAGSGDNR